jgi:hypothetical protein
MVLASLEKNAVSFTTVAVDFGESELGGKRTLETLLNLPLDQGNDEKAQESRATDRDQTGTVILSTSPGPSGREGAIPRPSVET